MADEGAYGSMNPNSQHQLWSRWTFGVLANPTKLPTLRECRSNFSRWCSLGFASTVGRVRCTCTASAAGTVYLFVVEIEGPPAHDPGYRDAVRRQFAGRFMRTGFGSGAHLCRFEVSVLAGDRQDGSPPDQLLVLPTLAVPGPQSLIH